MLPISSSIFCEQKFVQHGPLTIAIDCNGLSLLIFEEKLPNYASEPKSAPKCYADKPETIDALKDNIREVIGEIQLHTIDNVLKNWTDRVGYCMASWGNHLNEIIVHY